MKSVLCRPALFIIVFLFSSHSLRAENSADSLDLSKSTASVSLGYIGFYGSANVNYERLLAHSNRNSFLLKFGGGLVGGVDVKQYYFLTGLTMLTGRKNHHLEISLGVMPLFDSYDYQNDLDWWQETTGTSNTKPAKSDYWSVAPAGLLGYRYQKPNGGFLFRAGLGFPEMLYLGIGWAF